MHPRQARHLLVEGQDPPSMDDRLRALARPGELFVRSDAESGRCLACAHRCVLSEGRAGACGVRFVKSNQILVPYGYVARVHVRAIETNTLYHVLPGRRSLIFGMYGCDLRCPYCQNWKISQALREQVDEKPQRVEAAALVEQAVSEGCDAVCAAFNEPMIAAEWCKGVFAAAKARGLATAVVSDGHSTPEAIDYLRPVLDVYRVDLKGFSTEQYKLLGGRLTPVLASIEHARRAGLWVEVVTLVVPGFNDDPAGLGRLAGAIREIDERIPWHVNAFVPRYRMSDREITSPSILFEAYAMGFARGLRYVYAGNLPAQLAEYAHTRCPECHTVVVRRRDYAVTECRIGEDGRCPQCRGAIDGLWRKSAAAGEMTPTAVRDD